MLLDFTPGSSGRAPILAYTIKYNNDSFYDPVSARWKTLMVVQDAHLVWNLLPLTLPNLKPYSDYRFRVIAKNKVGSSNPSNASDTVRTLETGKKTRVSIMEKQEFARTLMSGPLKNVSKNRDNCEAPKLGGQISKSRSREMTFLGDIKKKETLSSYTNRNMKKNHYFKIFTEVSAPVLLLLATVLHVPTCRRKKKFGFSCARV